jgi:hypothetical protein
MNINEVHESLARIHFSSKSALVQQKTKIALANAKRARAWLQKAEDTLRWAQAQPDNFPPVAFRVVTVSNAPDAFGQWGHIVVDKNGNAYEVARQRGEWMGPSWAKGTDLEVPRRANGDLDWQSFGVELQPRSMGRMPAEVVAQVWREVDEFGRSK